MNVGNIISYLFGIVMIPLFIWFIAAAPSLTEKRPAQIYSDNLAGVVEIYAKVNLPEQEPIFPFNIPGFENQSPDDPEPSPREGGALGTGFFVESNIILTNSHVIKDASEIYIIGPYSNKKFLTKVIFSDEKVDIAALEVVFIEQYKKENGYKILKLGRSEFLKPGERITAIGQMLGYNNTVTSGIISGLNRQLGIENHEEPIFIQSDIVMAGGNSGGPLFDKYGNVIGINTAVARNKYGTFLSFTIESDIVKKVLRDNLEFKKTKWAKMGVEIKTDMDHQYPIITGVSEYLNAAKAGIKPGDAIILVKSKYTDKDGVSPVRMEDVLNEVLIMSPGDEITLTVLREGKELEFTFPLLPK